MAKSGRLLNLLNNPYPFYYRGKSLLQLVAVVFVLTLMFNYFFRPFNVDPFEHKMGYFWISFLHSCVPGVVMALVYPFIRFAPSLDEKWTTGKELLFLTLILFLIGIGQFLIRDLIYNNPNNWSWAYLAEEIRNTFLVGFLLVGIIISLNFNRLNARYVREAQVLGYIKRPFEHEADKFLVPIDTQVKIDRFELDVHSFLFAKAEGNYVMLYLLEGSSVNKVLKRIPIKELEKQLNHISPIIRTHRSYLVNLSFVESVKGNAQGFRLSFEYCSEIVPVSRNMIPFFESKARIT